MASAPPDAAAVGVVLARYEAWYDGAVSDEYFATQLRAMARALQPLPPGWAETWASFQRQSLLLLLLLRFLFFSSFFDADSLSSDLSHRYCWTTTALLTTTRPGAFLGGRDL